MPYYNKVGTGERGLPLLRERCKNKYAAGGREKCVPINQPAPVDTFNKSRFKRTLEALIAFAGGKRV